MILLALAFSALAIFALGVLIGVWLSGDVVDDWHEFQRACGELFDQDRM